VKCIEAKVPCGFSISKRDVSLVLQFFGQKYFNLPLCSDRNLKKNILSKTAASSKKAIIICFTYCHDKIGLAY
jgi:hypothetical protein